jgi:hypothetical protein
VTEKKYAFPPLETFRQPVPHSGGCLATDRIAVDGLKVGYMYREETNRSEDTGWRFFGGDESQEYLDDLNHSGVYAVNTIANHDPDILPYLDTPAPCAFERQEDTSVFTRVEE